MSAYEVCRLFQAIKAQYEVDGTIDPHQKRMLTEEMKKFDGGEKFVYRINEAFQQIESSDRFKLSASSGKHSIDREDTSQSSESLDDNSKVKFTGVGTLQSRRLKLKFDVALKVFNSFQLTCQVEKSPVEESTDFFSSAETEEAV